MNTNINIYSNDCNCMNCKEIVHTHILKSSLNIDCDDILKCIHEEIDTDKFKSWFNFNLDNFKSKTNQASYFKKAFINELKKGTFKLTKIEYIPNTQVLVNEMRHRGIIINADDIVWLNVVWEYLLGKMDIDDCVILNNSILDYMKTDEFREYKELLTKSKTLKQYEIDWNFISTKTATEIQEWNSLLSDLGDEL